MLEVGKFVDLWIKPLAKYFRCIWYADQWMNLSWSQEGEDLILKRFFGNKRDGFYVDVGVHHPGRFSNTKLFYLRGWHGINIDGSTDSVNELLKYRKRDINVERVVGPSNSTGEYIIFADTAYNGLRSEVTEGRTIVVKDVVKTKCTTLAEILNKYMPEDTHIDFLTIDVEGMDLEVLKSNDWEKYMPTMILIECLRSGSAVENVSEYLAQRGYVAFANTVNTYFYILR